MWPRIINIAIGLWLMFAPWVLGHTDPAAGSDRTVGPLVVAFGIMVIWEVLRPLRWVNFGLGCYLIIVPWLWGFPLMAAVNDLVCGIVIAFIALIRGKTTQRMDGGWRYLFFGERA